jgi:hypothetical protein
MGLSPRSVSTSRLQSIAAASSPTACTRKYSYDGIASYSPSSSILSAKCDITTRYGKLCNEGTSKADAGEFAYVNITKLIDTNNFFWAQFGYRRVRTGSLTITNYLYAEFDSWVGGHKTRSVEHALSSAAPADGSVHTYQIDIDNVRGICTFTFDSVVWWTSTNNPDWVGKKGNVLDFKGEVHNKQDDMPGKLPDKKCNFKNCAYKDSGGWHNTSFVASMLVPGPTDPKYGNEIISATEINIWDKVPNP